MSEPFCASTWTSHSLRPVLRLTAQTRGAEGAAGGGGRERRRVGGGGVAGDRGRRRLGGSAAGGDDGQLAVHPRVQRAVEQVCARRELVDVFFLILRPPPGSTLFPYTTLFR